MNRQTLWRRPRPHQHPLEEPAANIFGHCDDGCDIDTELPTWREPNRVAETLAQLPSKGEASVKSEAEAKLKARLRYWENQFVYTWH
jgi:hypothetical protein